LGKRGQLETVNRRPTRKGNGAGNPADDKLVWTKKSGGKHGDVGGGPPGNNLRGHRSKGVKKVKIKERTILVFKRDDLLQGSSSGERKEVC